MKAPMLLKQLVVGVGFSTIVVGAAMADPIASFDYTQEFEFVGWTPESDSDTPTLPEVTPSGSTDVDVDGVGEYTESHADNSGNVDGYTKLEWGTESNSENQVSSLVINQDPVPVDGTPVPSNDLTGGSIATSMDLNALIFEDGPTVTHNNYVITDVDDSLQTASMQDYVVLDPSNGADDQIQDITFDIDFLETTNNQDLIDDDLLGDNDPENWGEDHASGCTHGSINDFGCGDIFVLSAELLNPIYVNGGTILAFLIDQFVIDDYLYQVFITADGLGPLNSATCGLFSLEQCIGFTTFENDVNEFQLEFAILASEVPEPATLAIFAASLLLLGLVRRRKLEM